MARKREQVALSYDPGNADAVFVMQELANELNGQTLMRSATMWHWMAEYRRGHARAAADTEQDNDDVLVELLDDL